MINRGIRVKLQTIFMLNYFLRANYSLFLLSLISLFNPVFGQNSPKLIIRSDDIGSFNAANQAIIETYKNGITTSVELMVNCPWAVEAVKMLEENPNLDVGVHLMITSEWENCKWRPLTPAKSIVDEYGNFFSFIYPNKDVPNASIQEHPWKLEDIEKEFRAQIELARKMIPRISHISTHMGSGNWNPQVKKMVEKLSKEYNLPQDQDYIFEMFPNLDLKSKASVEDKIIAFLAALDELKDGKTYLFVEHPGLDVSEMENVGHEGYRNVREDRSDVTKILLDPRIKEKIQNLGIQLVDFKSLKPNVNW